MNFASPLRITSRDNSLIKEFKRLAQDSGAYRRQGRVWIEGDHLCRAALERGISPAMAVFTESGWSSGNPYRLQSPGKNIVIDQALMTHLSGLESPASMAYIVDLPAKPHLQPDVPTVVLDRVQDAGNVGSILRSAAAFGFGQVVAIKGTALLWSPKVLRSGMGAHFALSLIEGVVPEDLHGLKVPLLVTSSHDGDYLHRSVLPWPCAWVMGHEGQGVGAELAARAVSSVRIAQPGGEESLNVAAAAAICMHASAAARG